MDLNKIKQDIQNNNSGYPCLKQIVGALIVTKNNDKIYGYNNINKKVDMCPREILDLKSGEGYDLCHSVCKQNSHAEISAINIAKSNKLNIKGSTLFLSGHTYCCDNCLEAIHREGISKIVIIDTGVITTFK